MKRPVRRSNARFSPINEKVLSTIKIGGHHLYSSYRTRERGFGLYTSVSEQVQWFDFIESTMNSHVA
jgi:hypothetical protein